VASHAHETTHPLAVLHVFVYYALTVDLILMLFFSGVLLTACNQWVYHWRCGRLTARRHSRHCSPSVPGTESDASVT